MELWTRSAGGPWTRREPMSGLAAALDGRVGAVLVALDDADEVTDALRVARAVAPPGTPLLAAARHPSARWASRAREAGAARLLLADGGEPSRFDEVAVPVCPALHARDDGGVGLSVCGRHADRMVLSGVHLRRFCLGHNGGCPHWRPEADGSP